MCMYLRMNICEKYCLPSSILSSTSRGRAYWARFPEPILLHTQKNLVHDIDEGLIS